jgi:hypothetical protein
VLSSIRHASIVWRCSGSFAYPCYTGHLPEPTLNDSTGACTLPIAWSLAPNSVMLGPRGDRGMEALGRSCGGYSTKIQLRCERGGKTMVFVLTSGERHELAVLPLLMALGAIKRAGRGRSRVQREGLARDNGYDSPTVPRCLKERGILSPLFRSRPAKPRTRLSSESRGASATSPGRR